MRYPFNNSYPITSPFGMRDNPFATGGRELHDGVDFGCPANTPILASTPGKITVCTFSTLFGNYVELTESAEIMTRYCHLNAFNVSLGQNVKAGDIIGWCGTTGRSTGPHLHFGVAQKGTFVDPMQFLNSNNNQAMNNNQKWFEAIDASSLDSITKENNKQALREGNLPYAVGFLGSERQKNEIELSQKVRDLSFELNEVKSQVQKAKDESDYFELKIEQNAENHLSEKLVLNTKISELTKENDELKIKVLNLENGSSVTPTTPNPSSAKSPLQSKKFWVAFAGIAGYVATKYFGADSATVTDVTTQLIQLLGDLGIIAIPTAYIAVQGSIDNNSK